MCLRSDDDAGMGVVPCHPRRQTISRRTRTGTGTGSRGSIPNPIVLGHDGGRLLAPSSTTRTTRLRAPASGTAGTAGATGDVPFVVALLRFAVEPGVDVELILAGRAVLAQASADFPAHEPYRVFDELHRGAEDGVPGTVEIRVDPWVGRIRFEALLVYPERVAFREFEEFPWGLGCSYVFFFFSRYESRWERSNEGRTVSTLTQDPVPEIWPYSVHPPLKSVVVRRKLDVLLKYAIFIDSSFTLLQTWRVNKVCIRILDVDNIVPDSEIVAFSRPSFWAPI
jgi:hypothetical protein